MWVPYLLVLNFPPSDNYAMPPYFGPPSADEPTLMGLSKYEAFCLIHCQIKQAIKQLAPPKPDRQPPHDPFHKETGPWLCFGTGPFDQRHAGCWYQNVCFLDHTSHSLTNYFSTVHNLQSWDPAIHHRTPWWAGDTSPQKPLQHVLWT